MDMRRKVELFLTDPSQVSLWRRDGPGCGEATGSAWWMLRQALASAVPPERKVRVPAKSRLGPVIEFIGEILLNGPTRAPKAAAQHTAPGRGFGRSGPSSGWLNRPYVTGGIFVP